MSAAVAAATSHGLRASVEEPEVLVQNNNRKNGRRRLLDCDNPKLVNYKAKISLTSHRSHSCTDANLDGAVERIQYHWNNYVAYNSVLGPLDITAGELCPVNRRLVVANETVSDSSARRRLFSFNYNIGGQCRFCPGDNSDGRRGLAEDDGDNRRRLAAVPITFMVETDDYPGEMSMKIKDKNGFVVGSHSGFSWRRASKILPYDLNQGEEYTVEMKDSYGDGWCCSYGNGGVRVFDGTYYQGMDMMQSFDGKFTTAISHTFKVPTAGVTARSAGYADPADILFPELETGLSRYLTYYIYNEFNGRRGHCLEGAAPIIWVDIEAAASSSSISC